MTGCHGTRVTFERKRASFRVSGRSPEQGARLHESVAILQLKVTQMCYAGIPCPELRAQSALNSSGSPNEKNPPHWPATFPQISRQRAKNRRGPQSRLPASIAALCRRPVTWANRCSPGEKEPVMHSRCFFTCLAPPADQGKSSILSASLHQRTSWGLSQAASHNGGQ